MRSHFVISVMAARLLLVAVLLLAACSPQAGATPSPAARTVSLSPSSVRSTGPAATSTPAATPTPADSPVPWIRGNAVAVLTTQIALVSAGDRILRTLDGGGTWSVVRDGPIASEDYIRDLQWVGDLAFAASTHGLLRSGPSGSGWQQVSTRSDLYRLDFLTQTLGYSIADPQALGDGAVLMRTLDGGHSFEPVDAGLPTVQWVQFVSNQLGWVAGPRGIAVTRDGGLHWTRQVTFAPGLFEPPPGYPVAWTAQVGFRDSLHGFAYYRTRSTLMNQSGGVVYYTADGGSTWQGKACTCGYISIAPEVLMGAKRGLPDGGIESGLDVTGSASASIVVAGGVGSHTDICTTFSSGASWTCSALPFVKFSSGRLASLGPTRWLVLKLYDRLEVVIATSGDDGASWTVRSTVKTG